jgi:hypothetical protein
MTLFAGALYGIRNEAAEVKEARKTLPKWSSEENLFRHSNSTQFVSLSPLSGQSHEITNLETFTQYLVSIQVFNPEGLGPSSTVLIMTDEGSECVPCCYG